MRLLLRTILVTWLLLLALLALPGCQTYDGPPADLAMTATPAPVGEVVASDATLITRTGEGWSIRFPATAGQFYQVETSPDLERWSALSAPLPADRNALANAMQGRFPMTVTVLDPAHRHDAAFFRVREVTNPYGAP